MWNSLLPRSSHLFLRFLVFCRCISWLLLHILITFYLIVSLVTCKSSVGVMGYRDHCGVRSFHSFFLVSSYFVAVFFFHYFIPALLLQLFVNPLWVRPDLLFHVFFISRCYIFLSLLFPIFSPLLYTCFPSTVYRSFLSAIQSFISRCFHISMLNNFVAVFLISYIFTTSLHLLSFNCL